MNDRQAFLDQVLAHPDDDVPRLIYADYLEEVGDPRGEFIRLQCELAEIDELNPRYLDASHRCAELLFLHGETWAAELKQDVRKAEFARGFIDKITIRARAFIKEAGELYNTTPVNWLRFNYVKGAGAELAGVDALEKVRSLDLSYLKIPDDDLTALLTSPHLANLQALNLAHYEASYSEAVGAALSEIPSAPALRHLEISSGSTFLRAVARRGGFPKLERLIVGSSARDDDVSGLVRLKVPNLRALRVRRQLKAADCEVIAALPVDQLELLDLDLTRIPAKGLKHLAQRGAFDKLVELSLSSCGLGIRAADALFQGRQLSHCVELNLAHNMELGESGKSRSFLQKLAAHHGLEKLKRLHLGGLLAGDLELIARSPQFQNLELLELTGSVLGRRDIVALADNPISESLRQLNLIGFDMEPAAIKQLQSDTLFPNLRRLELGNGFDSEFNRKLDDAAIVHLLSSPAFAGVQAIKLDSLYMDARSFGTLAATVNLPELQELSYCFNQVSRKSIDTAMNSLLLPKLRKLIVHGCSGLGKREKLIDQYGWRVQF